MSSLSIRDKMNSILSGCSSGLSIAVHSQQAGGSAAAAAAASSSSGSSSSSSSSSRSSLLPSTILVAVDASRGIPDYAIKWAASNVVQSGDVLTLLAVFPGRGRQSGWKGWGFPGDYCASMECAHSSVLKDDAEESISEACSKLIHKLCSSTKVRVKVKVVAGASPSQGAVAAEARKLHASWIVLDRQLKKEAKCCVQGSPCNVVLVSPTGFRVLCLNLRGGRSREQHSEQQQKQRQKEEQEQEQEPAMLGLGLPQPLGLGGGDESSRKKVVFRDSSDSSSNKVYVSSCQEEAGNESDEMETPFTATERGSSASSASSTGCSEHENSSRVSVPERKHSGISSAAAPALDSSAQANATGKNDKSSFLGDQRIISQTRSILSDAEHFIKQVACSINPQDLNYHLAALQLDSEDRKSSTHRCRPAQRSAENLLPIDESAPTSTSSATSTSCSRRHADQIKKTSRRAVPLPVKRMLADSPPLCSVCQHPSPVFGRPPRRFTYTELEFATGSFCKANFLAEGGYGSVHRGVLADGIPVAVKQYKLASSQGDMEFCSEVEVLSCAQHRNVVMLIGYCVEKNRRLLVYEFICNGSLDLHLYGHNRRPLKWSPRHKVAVGAARGLRYLHEECRVGCIVHRDMRPNNILLTHDFEPMVGDFGLARWQPDADLAVETRVIGTFGYLAPEYAQTGQITDKADVYSFGVVLLELVSGRKAIDISQPRGQQCLTEWARPLLDEQAHHEMMDPRLDNDYNQYEAYCMLYAASLCTQRDPHLRPRMSQVLRILEGDLSISRNSSPMRSSSGRWSASSPLSRSTSPYSGRSRPSPLSMHSDATFHAVASYMSAHPIIGCNTKLSHEALKAAYKHNLDGC